MRTRSFVALLATAFIGCSNKADDCHWTRTCGEYETGGTASDAGSVGGKVGSGGKVNTGGKVGSGGLIATGGVLASGGASSTGGVLATGGAPTCAPACQGATPACDISSLTCVQCTDNQYCSGPTPVCDVVSRTCVQCTNDQHCGNGRPFCDILKATCVECLDNEDCKSPSASSCVAGKCSPCATNSDCSHLAGTGVCKPTLEADAGAETGVCVECTGTDYAACTDGDAGARHVCDSLKSTCTEIVERTAGLCQPCVSDAQCQPGELCIEQIFNGKSAGHFCMYQQGAAGAPADCTTAPPYVKTLATTSIDGSVANVCSLRVSTCTALNQFSRTSCASASNNPDDSLCGFVPGVDSKCVAFGASQHLCTVVCGSDLDCKSGFTCNTGVNPNICNLL